MFSKFELFGKGKMRKCIQKFIGFYRSIKIKVGESYNFSKQWSSKFACGHNYVSATKNFY